jgi:hypothetical protein
MGAMSEFDIEVVGAKPPPRPDGPIRRLVRKALRLARAMFMRPRALAFAGAAAFVLFVGTPHVGWDYACTHRPRPGQPCRSVDYCAYYGIQGRRVVFPASGETCQLITVLPLDWQRIV